MAITDEDLDAAFRASPLFQELERRIEEDAEAPDSAAKRHHFIPRFLLCRFLAPGNTRLFQLDTSSGTPQAITPSEAASRRHFYSAVGEDGVRHARVESFLSTIEGHAATALDRFITDPERLAPGDRATLAYFFGLFGIRTPRAAGRLATGSDSLMKMMLAGRITHPDVFARDYREAVGEASAEEIEALRIEMLAALEEGRVEIDDPRAHAIGIGLSLSADLASLIHCADWTLCKSDAEFVTSDTGLAMVDPTPRFPWSGNAWASSPNAQTTIPLGSRACLLISAGDAAALKVTDIDASETETINLRTYGWASDYIYGSSQDVVTNVRRAAKRRPGDVARPRPEHYMILVDASPSDTSLADQHDRRGWPRYFMVEGKEHDYIVIGVDGSPVESGERASQLARQRAQAEG